MSNPTKPWVELTVEMLQDWDRRGVSFDYGAGEALAKAKILAGEADYIGEIVDTGIVAMCRGPISKDTFYGIRDYYEKYMQLKKMKHELQEVL